MLCKHLKPCHPLLGFADLNGYVIPAQGKAGFRKHVIPASGCVEAWNLCFLKPSYRALTFFNRLL